MFCSAITPIIPLLYEEYHLSAGSYKIDAKSKKPIEPVQFDKASGDVFVSQEYPNSQGYTYRQSIDLRSDPAVMTWQNSKQPFWLGIGNVGKNNFLNPTLFLDFEREKVEIKLESSESRGWREIGPNVSYVHSAKGVLQPGVLTRLNPLYIKFPDEGTYRVKCTVTGDNTKPMPLNFNIKVQK